MYKKKSLSNLILLVLEKTADGYVRFEDFTTHYYRYHYGAPELKKSQFSLTLKRLRENGLIDFVDDNKLILKLTDKGRTKALKSKILLEDEKWDGKWRIVIWDIPEKRRTVRDVLRKQLKSWSFTQWQRSVWATKKNCAKPLREFINKTGIDRWVRVIESDNVE